MLYIRSVCNKKGKTIVICVIILALYTAILSTQFSQSLPNEPDCNINRLHEIIYSQADILNAKSYFMSTLPKLKYHHKPVINCSKSLIILVKSTVVNIVQRTAIRSTWGNITGVNVIFVLGENKLVDEYIEIEARNHNDILQGNFTDSYFNNTYKSVMTFTWVTTYCSKTPYLFFVDDDFIVNVPNIIKYFNLQTNAPYIYRGFLITKNIPVRNNQSKWYISNSEYKPDFFPPYLAGGSVLMTMNVAIQFTATFHKVNFIFVDDVYLGLVAKESNIIPSNESRIAMSYTPISNNKFQYVFCSHGFDNPQFLIKTWSSLSNSNS